MKTVSYTYWQDGQFFLGFFNDYPDYPTQGMSKDELVANLKDLLKDLTSDELTKAMNQVCAEVGELNDPFVSAAARRVLEQSEW